MFVLKRSWGHFDDNSQWNPLFMSDTHVKCQGLRQPSKNRPYNHRPGISPLFICQVGKPAVLGQHYPRIKLIPDIWHCCMSSQIFFYNISKDSLNMLYIIWAQHRIVRRILHQPQTCDHDDNFSFYTPPPGFPVSFTYFCGPIRSRMPHPKTWKLSGSTDNKSILS